MTTKSKHAQHAKGQISILNKKQLSSSFIGFLSLARILKKKTEDLPNPFSTNHH
jgi:hypothetical protein